MWQISTKTGPRKSTRHPPQESVISRTPVWRILHDGVKLFPYKIQILRRQTDQKKSRRRNILERYPSKDRKWPWLVGFEWFERCRPLWPLYDICHTSCLPKVGHQTLNLLLGTLLLPKSLLQFCCVRRTDFVAKYASIIFIRCCVVNCPVESILVSKESPRPADYISLHIYFIY